MREIDFLGKGFAFPISVDPTVGQMNMAGYEDSIKQSIYIILMTRKGERPMRPDFGCGIHDYVFSSMDYFNISRIKEEVNEALLLWEPRIENVEVDVIETEEAGRLDINISYVVRMTNNPYNLVYPFYLNEGLDIE